MTLIFGKEVVLLIDEYHMSLVKSFNSLLKAKANNMPANQKRDFYESNCYLLSGLLFCIFKQPQLKGLIKFAYFTGIFRVGGSGFSQTNRVSIFTPERCQIAKDFLKKNPGKVEKIQHQPCFFSEAETQNILKLHATKKMELNEELTDLIKKKYNGYKVGEKANFYNPINILGFLSSGMSKDYIQSTESYGTLKTLIKNCLPEAILWVFELINPIKGHNCVVEVKQLPNKVDFEQNSFASKQNLIVILIDSGLIVIKKLVAIINSIDYFYQIQAPNVFALQKLKKIVFQNIPPYAQAIDSFYKVLENSVTKKGSHLDLEINSVLKNGITLFLKLYPCVFQCELVFQRQILMWLLSLTKDFREAVARIDKQDYFEVKAQSGNLKFKTFYSKTNSLIIQELKKESHDEESYLNIGVLPKKIPDLLFISENDQLPNVLFQAKFNEKQDGLVLAMAKILSRGYLIPGCLCSESQVSKVLILIGINYLKNYSGNTGIDIEASTWRLYPQKFTKQEEQDLFVFKILDFIDLQFFDRVIEAMNKQFEQYSVKSKKMNECSTSPKLYRLQHQYPSLESDKIVAYGFFAEDQKASRFYILANHATYDDNYLKDVEDIFESFIQEKILKQGYYQCNKPLQVVEFKQEEGDQQGEGDQPMINYY